MTPSGTIRYCSPSLITWSNSLSFVHLLAVEPLHCTVPKTAGDWRPCGDYRALNVTTPVCYQYHTFKISVSLHSATIFSKIDLVRAYSQIPVERASKQQTVHHLGFSNFSACHSDCKMPLRCSSASSTRSYTAYTSVRLY